MTCFRSDQQHSNYVIEWIFLQISMIFLQSVPLFLLIISSLQNLNRNISVPIIQQMKINQYICENCGILVKSCAINKYKSAIKYLHSLPVSYNGTALPGWCSTSMH